MQHKVLAFATAATWLCTIAASATPLQIDYSSTVGSFITFNGNSTFDLTPSSASFKITDGTAAGLTGEITGLFTIGAVVAGDAPVTGTGLLTINNGATPLTAAVTWVDLYTFGTLGGLNTGGVVDLSGISYAGTNPDLMSLAAGVSGINVLTFQFIPKETVTQLKTGFHRTSFSGSITQNPSQIPVPDEGRTLLFLGGACFMLFGLPWKKVGLFQ